MEMHSRMEVLEVHYIWGELNAHDYMNMNIDDTRASSVCFVVPYSVPYYSFYNILLYIGS